MVTVQVPVQQAAGLGYAHALSVLEDEDTAFL
jgi:hypothetical protein